MTPVSPVLPSIAGVNVETIYAEHQDQYDNLPAVYLDTPARNVISRWRLTDEERAMIANGADIILQQLTFNIPLQPANLQVVMPNEYPVFVQEPES